MEPMQMLFLIQLAKAGLLCLAFLITAMGSYAMLCSLVKDKTYHGLFFGMGLVIGPFLLSWFLTLLLTFMPGQSRLFYILLPLLPFFIPAILRARRIWADIKGFANDYLALPKIRWAHAIAGLFTLALIVFGLGGLVVVNALTPLHGNDALEYFSVAKHIAQARDAGVYPIIDNTVAGGFMAPWTHPLGYINQLTYGYLIQGSLEQSFVPRFVAPYYGLAMAAMMIAFAGFQRKISGPIAAYLLLATPLFYSLIIQCHIDPARIAAFTAAICAVWIACQKPSLITALIAGIACGCSMFSHSIGILTLPLAVPIYILLARRANIFVHLISLGLIVGLPIAMLALRYAVNLKVFGGFINDSVEIWTFPELSVDHTRNVMRFMESPLDQIFNGALMGFTNTGLFGLHYYILGFALLLWIVFARKTLARPVKFLLSQKWRRDSDPTYAAFLVVLGYTGIMFLTILAGTDLAIKNARYLLTLQPFIIMASVRILALYCLGDSPTPRYRDGAQLPWEVALEEVRTANAGTIAKVQAARPGAPS